MRGRKNAIALLFPSIRASFLLQKKKNSLRHYLPIFKKERVCEVFLFPPSSNMKPHQINKKVKTKLVKSFFFFISLSSALPPPPFFLPPLTSPRQEESTSLQLPFASIHTHPAPCSTPSSSCTRYSPSWTWW